MPNSTSRLGLTQPLTSDAVATYRTAMTSNAGTLDAAVVFAEDTISNRPAASIKGRVFHATDTDQWYLDTGSAWVVWPVGARGATNIATSQSTSSTTYTTLGTPDQVTGIVLPANGLIAVWYQATWAESANGAARAAFFLGSNQLKLAVTAAAAPQTQAAQTNATGTPGTSYSLASAPFGLFTFGSNPGYSGGDVTTGQAVGIFTSPIANTFIELGGSPVALGTSSSGIGFPQMGPCYIFATAGTYTISVRFKVSSGSVTASNRKLWVQALSFG